MTAPTVILGVPESPVALPVKAPVIAVNVTAAPVTLFTVISGVPESPVAFPARLPENEDAVKYQSTKYFR